MKTSFLIFTLFFISFFQSIATFAQSLTDTIAKEKYRLSKNEFLKLYGNDDTSKAIINYYYQERSIKKEYCYFYAGVLIIEGILVGQTIAYESELPYLESSLAPMTIAYTAIVFIPITTYTLIKLNKTLTKFCRKNLYNDLVNFRNGKGIPTSYKDKLKFNSLKN